ALGRSLKRSWSAGALACGLNITPHDIFRAPKVIPSDMPSRAAAQIKLHITFANSKCAGEGTALLLLIRHDNFLTLSS
ncbi:MAG: hypothetical protein ACRD72_15740, partial [Candidatus Angelobacter sp.]